MDNPKVKITGIPKRIPVDQIPTGSYFIADLFGKGLDLCAKISSFDVDPCIILLSDPSKAWRAGSFIDGIENYIPVGVKIDIISFEALSDYIECIKPQ